METLRDIDFEAVGYMLLQFFGVSAGLSLLIFFSIIFALLFFSFVRRILCWILDG